MPTCSEQSVSVILPAFDEAACIERAVREAHAALHGTFGQHEIVVVDDGSTDDTAARVRELQATIPELRLVSHLTNYGYGRALRTGFAVARHELVFFTDADCQFDVGALAGTVPRLVDAVLGYRRRPRYGFVRAGLSRGYNALARCCFGVGVRDVNCSFKLFRKPVLDGLELHADDFFIDTEIVLQLQARGHAVVELPVEHRPRLAGRSSVRPVRMGQTLRTIGRALWRARRARRAAAPPAAATETT